MTASESTSRSGRPLAARTRSARLEGRGGRLVPCVAVAATTAVALEERLAAVRGVGALAQSRLQLADGAVANAAVVNAAGVGVGVGVGLLHDCPLGDAARAATAVGARGAATGWSEEVNAATEGLGFHPLSGAAPPVPVGGLRELASTDQPAFFVGEVAAIAVQRPRRRELGT